MIKESKFIDRSRKWIRTAEVQETMQVQNIKIGSFVTTFLTPAGSEAPPESIPVASEFILAERTMHHDVLNKGRDELHLS